MECVMILSRLSSGVISASCHNATRRVDNMGMQKTWACLTNTTRCIINRGQIGCFPRMAANSDEEGVWTMEDNKYCQLGRSASASGSNDDEPQS
eukprot:CCRYP_003218-RA/>CCRYP_003218-RA protein AED:0.44 eAED:0.50 QI:0/0/0/1/0/0/2/0/93